MVYIVAFKKERAGYGVVGHISFAHRNRAHYGILRNLDGAVIYRGVWRGGRTIERVVDGFALRCGKRDLDLAVVNARRGQKLHHARHALLPSAIRRAKRRRFKTGIHPVRIQAVTHVVQKSAGLQFVHQKPVRTEQINGSARGA